MTKKSLLVVALLATLQLITATALEPFTNKDFKA